MNGNQLMGLRIRFNGGGCMNGNQLMELRIRFNGGGCTNSAWQSIRGATNSMVEDALTTINSWGSE